MIDSLKIDGQKIGYVRVSSIGQNIERQLENIELDETFTDKLSGAKKDRKGLNDCIKYCRKGDKLFVHSMDRLARNLTDLKNVVEQLNNKGVHVHFVKENLNFTGENSSIDNLMMNIMGSVAEFERSLIKERQMEGIKIAKSKGKHLGRFKSLDLQQIKELI